MVGSESIRSGNVLVQSTHPGPQPLHPVTTVYLITRGKTVVAKGLVFYTSLHIYTLALPLTQPLIPDQPVEKPTACTIERSRYLSLLL